MPFGAEVIDGGVRFGLWAPAAQRVELCLEGPGRERILATEAQPDGWFRLETEAAQPGTLYRYRIDGGVRVPDPASRFQPRDVHGPSQVLDPGHWIWGDGAWRGRPWEETVLYELHVGTFTPQGTYRGVAQRLPALVDLGVTAVELMPVAEFAGVRNWGYDGVLPFAPERCYGHPDDLKALVEAAHAHGLMIFLDVVYNHFGPEGNYLHRYAPEFFSRRQDTPWGPAVNFDGEHGAWVRRFFVDNACYWLEEYGFDGLRLDAVHGIRDHGDPHILTELAQAVHTGPGSRRPVHLVLENDENASRYLARDASGRPRAYVAQWNDDFHHVLHVLATAETTGYYQDYDPDPTKHLGRCLREGFAYQGEASAYRGARPRGESTAGLPPTAFVNFLQNHDQVGNRARGERVTMLASAEAVRAATAVLLLAPSPPLLFMGQEWAAHEPFPYFCDFDPELGASVREGRRREFAEFRKFSDEQAQHHIPDPLSTETFASARLDWGAREQPQAREWLAFHRRLLRLRRREIVPRLGRIVADGAVLTRLGERALAVEWPLEDGGRLALAANLGHEASAGVRNLRGRLLYATDEQYAAAPRAATLGPWTVRWFVA